MKHSSSAHKISTPTIGPSIRPMPPITTMETANADRVTLRAASGEMRCNVQPLSVDHHSRPLMQHLRSGFAARSAAQSRTLNSRSRPHCGHRCDDDVSTPLTASKVLQTFPVNKPVAASRTSAAVYRQLELSTPMHMSRLCTGDSALMARRQHRRGIRRDGHSLNWT